MLMLGYREPSLVLDEFDSFMKYEESSVVVFMIKMLAKRCGYNAWLLPSKEFDSSRLSNYIDVTYTVGMALPAKKHVIMPHVLRSKDCFMGNIEATGYASSGNEYLELAVKSYAGSLYECTSKKMFENSSVEMLMVEADLHFAGDIDEHMV